MSPTSCPVALKFVSSDLLDEPEARRRLLREARSSATLNHPNICNNSRIGNTALFGQGRWDTGQQYPCEDLVERMILRGLSPSSLTFRPGTTP